MAELRRGAEIKIPEFYKYIIKYVTPLYLLVVFFLWLRQNFVVTSPEQNRIRQLFTDPVVGGMAVFILAVGVLFALLIAQSVKNWRRIEASQEEVVI
ncbi:MAG: hypothetical protein H5U08_19030 [Thermogutta sp.]|nr:hypothetical protein [Thermogutta sp.]